MVLFSMLLKTHGVATSTQHDNLNETFSTFKRYLNAHNVQRPPFSEAVFTLPDSKAVMDFVLNTYFRHFKLYKYCFTPAPAVRLAFEPIRPGFPGAAEAAAIAEARAAALAAEAAAAAAAAAAAEAEEAAEEAAAAPEATAAGAEEAFTDGAEADAPDPEEEAAHQLRGEWQAAVAAKLAVAQAAIDTKLAGLG